MCVQNVKRSYCDTNTSQTKSVIWPAGCLLHVVLPKVWHKNVQRIDWSAEFERWQHILFIIWPWLLSQMAAVMCRTHITHKLITRSLFFTHTFSLTHTHPHTNPGTLYAYSDALSQYASCHCKLLWQHFASCLPIHCSFYLFSLLGSQSEVTCVRHFPINLNSVRCNAL